MYSQALLLSVTAQIALAIVLYVLLAIRKARAVRERSVDESRRALHDDAWPDHVQQVNNCIRNQFEVPVLFHVLALMLWHLQQTGALVAAIAGLFVLSRWLHAFVHVGSNHVPTRRRLFMLGVACVLALLVIAVRAALAG